MKVPTPPRRAQNAAAASASPAITSRRAASGDCAVAVVPLEAGFYAFNLAGYAGRPMPVAALPLPAVHLCSVPGRDGDLEIVDDAGGTSAWLGGARSTLFVTSQRGGAALVTAYLAQQPQPSSLELEIRRVDPEAGDAASAAAIHERPLPPLLSISLGAPGAGSAAGPVRLDVVAHIRGRGDVQFPGDAVIGGPGQGRSEEGRVGK